MSASQTMENVSGLGGGDGSAASGAVGAGNPAVGSAGTSEIGTGVAATPKSSGGL